MYQKTDEYIASILHVPLSFLCKLTGRSNYFFAITTMIFSMAVNMLYYSFKLTLGKFDIIDGFLWPLNFLWCIFMILLFRVDQAKVESSTTAIHKSQFTASSWLFVRVFICIMSVFNLFFDLLMSEKYLALSPVLLLLWVAAVYFAIDNIPRGKGWIRQKTEAIVNSIKNVKVPSLNPVPPPVTG